MIHMLCRDVPQTVKVEHESEGRELEDVLPKLIAGILAYWHRVLGAAAITALTSKCSEYFAWFPVRNCSMMPKCVCAYIYVRVYIL